MTLLCGKCKKECDASHIRICSDCGSFFCEECSAQNNEYCPSCWGGLGRLS